MKLNLFNMLIMGGLSVLPICSPSADQFNFHHEGVLGTSLDLSIESDSIITAGNAEAYALKEIERLSEIFSSYSRSSELSQWLQTQNQPIVVSKELSTVFEMMGRWQVASHGAFSPATDELAVLWKTGAKTGKAPDDNTIRNATKKASERHWKWDPEQASLTRLSDARLTLNSIAKGFIIDLTGERLLQEFPASQSCMINIGGDLRLFGSRETEVKISDPFDGAENVTIETIKISGNTAIATSGNYRRGFQIGDNHYSHIFDPRSGYPVDHIASSTVLAPSAADADALATIFSVLKVEQSLALANQLPGVECLLIEKDGSKRESEGWQAYRSPAMDSSVQFQVAQATQWSEQFEFIINFQLNRISGRRYRRPYVAVWITDADKVPVKTLSLWIQKERWLPDLKSWYRDDKLRRLFDDTDLVETISSATRPPGKYRLKWDGTDDLGLPTKPGNYFLQIEVTREHGTYQIIRKELTIQNEPFKIDFEENTELKSASIEYRPKKSI
jgi:FAD:protein FMN transferase